MFKFSNILGTHWLPSLITLNTNNKYFTISKIYYCFRDISFYIKLKYYSIKLSLESNIILIRTDKGQNLKIVSSVDFTNVFFLSYLNDY